MPKTKSCPTCGTLKPSGFHFTIPSVKARPVVQFSERTEHGVIAPFLQSGISGVLAGLAGTVSSNVFWPTYENPQSIGALAGLAAMSVVWGLAVWDDRQRVWYELERTLGIDLNRDGVIGEPEPPRKEQRFQPPDAWVGSKPPGRIKMAYERFPIPFIDYAEAQAVARHVVVHGKPFTRRGLTDNGALSDDPEHYSEIFNAMMGAGLLIKKGNGGVPNDKGREYLAACLAPPPRV